MPMQLLLTMLTMLLTMLLMMVYVMCVRARTHCAVAPTPAAPGAKCEVGGKCRAPSTKPSAKPSAAPTLRSCCGSSSPLCPVSSHAHTALATRHQHVGTGTGVGIVGVGRGGWRRECAHRRGLAHQQLAPGLCTCAAAGPA
jgi:hypothetical protein